MGYVKEELKPIVYLNVSCGRFVKGRGDKKEEFNKVTGSYVGHTLKHDPGNVARKIKEGYKLWVVLDDGTERITVSTRMDTTFSWMFASFLGSINHGDALCIETWHGTDVEKVSVCMVKGPDENGEFKPLPRTEFPADVTEKHRLANKIVRDHACWIDPEVFKPKDDNGDSDESPTDWIALALEFPPKARPEPWCWTKDVTPQMFTKLEEAVRFAQSQVGEPITLADCLAEAAIALREELPAFGSVKDPKPLQPKGIVTEADARLLTWFLYKGDVGQLLASMERSGARRTTAAPGDAEYDPFADE